MENCFCMEQMNIQEITSQMDSGWQGSFLLSFGELSDEMVGIHGS